MCINRRIIKNFVSIALNIWLKGIFLKTFIELEDIIVFRMQNKMIYYFLIRNIHNVIEKWLSLGYQIHPLK